MRRRGSGLQCHDAGHEVEVLVGQAVFQHGEAHVVALVGGFNVRVVEEFARLVGRCLMFVHGFNISNFSFFSFFLHAYT